MNRLAIAVQGVGFGRLQVAVQGFAVFDGGPPSVESFGLVYSPWRSPLRSPWRTSIRW